MKKHLCTLLACVCAAVAPLSAQTAEDLNEGLTLTWNSATETAELSWYGHEGRTYFVMHDGIEWDGWIAMPLVELGQEEVISHGFSTTGSDAFFKLNYVETPTDDPLASDFDGDGFSNWYEVSNQLDPLDFYNGETPTLSIISGNEQGTVEGQYLDAPLVVRVQKPNGDNWVNAPVTFSVSSGDGELSPDREVTSSTVEARTGSDGRATVYWLFEDESGTPGVTATAGESSVQFEPGDPRLIYVDPNPIREEVQVDTVTRVTAMLRNDTGSEVHYEIELSDNDTSSRATLSEAINGVPDEDISFTPGTRLDDISYSEGFPAVSTHVDIEALTGWEFPFYGQSFGGVYVSRHGVLSFGSAYESSTNEDLGSGGYSSASVPLLLACHTGAWYAYGQAYTFFDQANDRLIIGLYGYQVYDGPTCSVEIALYENGDIELLYDLPNSGLSYTVGLRDATGASTKAIAYNPSNWVDPAPTESPDYEYVRCFIPAAGSGYGTEVIDRYPLGEFDDYWFDAVQGGPGASLELKDGSDDPDPDAGSAPIQLVDGAEGFAVEWYGQSYTSARVWADGVITFGSSTTQPPSTNTAMPIAGLGALIAPLWGDLETTGGGIYFRRFEDYQIIQYNNVYFKAKPAEKYTFQVIFPREGQPILFFKNSGGASEAATVGVQGAAGAGARTFWFNGPRVLRVIGYDDPWRLALPDSPPLDLTQSNASGVLSGYDGRVIEMHFNSTDLSTIAGSNIWNTNLVVHYGPDAGSLNSQFTVPFRAIAVLVGAADDINDNTLLDAWETEHFGHLLSNVEAAQDTDGDGFNQREEYHQGKDPHVYDFQRRINFQKVSSTTPEGYEADIGSRWTNLDNPQGYGWNHVRWDKAFDTTAIHTELEPRFATGHSMGAGPADVSWRTYIDKGSELLHLVVGHPDTAETREHTLRITYTGFDEVEYVKDIELATSAAQPWTSVVIPIIDDPDVPLSEADNPIAGKLLVKIALLGPSDPTDLCFVEIGKLVPGVTDLNGNGLADYWEFTQLATADADFTRNLAPGDLASQPPGTFPPRNTGLNPDANSDPDSLTNREEAAAGSNPLLADTDSDGVNDDLDGWPTVAAVAPPRLPIPRYTVIDLGIPDATRVVGLNDRGEVLCDNYDYGQNWDDYQAWVWSKGTVKEVPHVAGIHVLAINNSGLVLGQGFRWDSVTEGSPELLTSTYTADDIKIRWDALDYFGTLDPSSEWSVSPSYPTLLDDEGRVWGWATFDATPPGYIQDPWWDPVQVRLVGAIGHEVRYPANSSTPTLLSAAVMNYPAVNESATPPAAEGPGGLPYGGSQYEYTYPGNVFTPRIGNSAGDLLGILRNGVGGGYTVVELASWDHRWFPDTPGEALQKATPKVAMRIGGSIHEFPSINPALLDEFGTIILTPGRHIFTNEYYKPNRSRAIAYINGSAPGITPVYTKVKLTQTSGLTGTDYTSVTASNDRLQSLVYFNAVSGGGQYLHHNSQFYPLASLVRDAEAYSITHINGSGILAGTVTQDDEGFVALLVAGNAGGPLNATHPQREGGSLTSRPADASNPEYAHIALNGRPLPGREPMSKAESDMERELSYIDAFSLQLRHNVSDVYVPIPGSDLALSVRRNWSGEQWNERAGLRPSERPDLPFGAGWSSNLTANVHLVYQNSTVLSLVTPANYAYVTDHNGAVYRFVIAETEEGEQYFPLPESRIDQETYLCTLTRSGSTFTFRKKHGTTLTFTLDTGLDKTVNSNRLGTSSHMSQLHQYARLNEAEDRLGYTLTYAYGGSATLIPSTITSFSGQFISIGSSSGRINSVTDPRGKTTNYYYNTSSDHGGYAFLDYILQPQDEDAVRPRTEYRYGDGTNTVVTEPDDTPNIGPDLQTPWYHLDLKEIEDPREKVYSFTYAFDHSAQYVDTAAGFYPVNGRPRVVTSVTLPGSNGTATFANHSYSAILSDYITGKPKFFGHRSCLVTDTEGYSRSYLFDDIELQELQEFESKVKPLENPVEVPQIAFYKKLTVTHYTDDGVTVTETPGAVAYSGSVGGTESYTFNVEAGLALESATDMSGNTVTYSYDDSWNITANHPWLQPLDFPFGKYADPTGKVDAMGFTESWEYDSTWRLLTKYVDKESHRTDYELGTQGQTRFEKVYESTSGGTPVQSTEMVYGNSTFKGFVTQNIRRTTNSSGPQEFDLVTEYVPDAFGRVQDEIVAPGDLDLTTSYEYDLNNNKIQATDPRNNVTDFQYDDIGRFTKVTYPLITGASVRAEKTMKYDLSGNLLQDTDERGHKTHYVYDDLSRLEEQYRDMDGDGPDNDVDLKQSYTYNNLNSRLTATDARGNTTTSIYDWAQRLETVTDADDKTTTYGYNIITGNAGGQLFAGRGFQPTSVTHPIRGTDTSAYADTFTYDDNYRLTQVSQQYKLAPSPLYAVTSTAYDHMGNPELVTDPLNEQTQTVYDALYRPETVTRALGTADESTVTTHYTTTGLVHQVVDGRGNVIDTEYDEAGRLRFTKLPLVDDGSGSNNVRPVSETIYDDSSNVIARINPRGALTLLDPDDFRWDYEYDERNRKTDEFGPEGFDYGTSTSVRPHTNWEYDDAGNVVKLTDARGNTTDSHYDPANRPWKTELPAVYDPVSTNMVRPTTIAGFDRNGNVLTATDANGHVTTNTYDDLNRLKTTEDAEGIIVENFYDAAGNLTRVEDGKGQPTIFEYDGLNRNTKITDAAGKFTTFTFNALNKTGRADAMFPPQVTSYNYDHKHRLASVTYTGRSQDNRVYTYDANDNLETVTESGKGGKADVVYTYDALNRVQTEESQGTTHIYRYDVAGNRVFVEYGGTTRQVISTYDELSRLDSITENGRITTYRYDLNGNTCRRILGNGETITQVFDGANRLISQVGATSAPAQLYSYTYEYDLKGNLTKSTEDYAAGGVSDRTVVNTYEDNDRLDTETITTGSGSIATDYGYDDANNRLSKVVTGGSDPGSTSYSYNALNQLTDYTLPDTSTITLTYDFNGNRATKTGGLTYGYDYENRLVSLTGGATNYAYIYDYRTRRVERTEGATVTSVVFSGGLSVQEIESGITPTTTVEYVRGSDLGGGIGGILYTLRSGTPSYNHYNNRGDVTTKTSSASAVTYQAAYEAFGTRTDESGSTTDRQKANTKEEDPTGLLCEHFRYRDLEANVFITRDPLGFVDGPNLYTYVRQNPWSAWDPLGLASLKEVLGDNNQIDNYAELGSLKLTSGEATQLLKVTGREISTPESLYERHIAFHWNREREMANVRKRFGVATDEEALSAWAAHVNFRKAKQAAWDIWGAANAQKAFAVYLPAMELTSYVATLPADAFMASGTAIVLTERAWLTVTKEVAKRVVIGGGKRAESVPIPPKSGLNVVPRKGMVPVLENGCKIYGQAASSSKTLGHAETITSTASAWAKTGEYEYITMQRSWRTATGRVGTSNLIPDLIGVRRNGIVDALEVISDTDIPAELMLRLEQGMATLPEARRGTVSVLHASPTP